MEIIQYQESFGSVNWQEGFEKELEGLSIEEQLKCYALSEYTGLRDIPYTEVEAAVREHDFYGDGLHGIPEHWCVIVDNGKVVGVAYDKYDDNWKVVGKTPLMPYRGYVYASTSDNNGSGYKERDWYKYLICLPRGHKLL